ncbi:putative quinol monooxygenase [Ihubacter sp. rT4E-8]|uniref:putative quinol monooxygenase n=1 Tax=unclassified Ihubacter TaxID=2633299 RepID=UPI00137B48AA
MTNFYVTYTLECREERDAFFDEVKASGVIEASRAEEGCIRYSYYYPADAENQIFLWEQWESRDAQQRHTQQPHFKKLGRLKEKYRMETEIQIEDQTIVE